MDSLSKFGHYQAVSSLNFKLDLQNSGGASLLRQVSLSSCFASSVDVPVSLLGSLVKQSLT
jgi:hypothetical protein